MSVTVPREYTRTLGSDSWSSFRCSRCSVRWTSERMARLRLRTFELSKLPSVCRYSVRLLFASSPFAFQTALMLTQVISMTSGYRYNCRAKGHHMWPTTSRRDEPTPWFPHFPHHSPAANGWMDGLPIGCSGVVAYTHLSTDGWMEVWPLQEDAKGMDGWMASPYAQSAGLFLVHVRH
ncbi:uncharacterized protein EV422DRAFT_224668 [Fimicolochytrium jonesii]|uniref:uncharacterized protein n=1 Tax=Fimicolochytrium jonesii TaxID=1396493 RepID=UPI0022FDF48B|nr:uncharacterized protein EV422DRAFT_224668 [Fimicolochytrium jonesii]KAI8817429.1 hypothetical protein EV422DRAFT_224668 [Fimicolochytrium jonesii]